MKKPSKRHTPVTTTIQAAIEDGLAALQELRDEMQELVDNTPENLQGSDLYSRREEAASTLDGFVDEGPDCHPDWADLDCSHTEDQRKRQSRATRRNNATAKMSGALEALEAWISDNEDDSSDAFHEAENLAQELQSWIDDAESVEFPGMYG